MMECIFACNPNYNLYHRRCEAIRKQLEDAGMNIKRLCRHNMFGEEFYLLKVDTLKSKEYPSECDIAKALDIPVDWIDFGGLVDNVNIYYIKEKEFNDKYCDCDGEIVFEKWCLKDKFTSPYFIHHIKNRLDDKCFKYDGLFYDRSSNLIFIKCNCSDDTRLRLAKILGIKDEMDYFGRLYDDECDKFEGSGWIYIYLNKVIKDD